MTDEPKSFVARINDEFGLQWTQIAVFSGLVFGTFGLEEYFNTGAWMVGTVTAFTVAYVFRRQIPGSLIAVTAGAIVLLILGIGGPYVYQLHQKAVPIEVLKDNVVFFSFYLSIVVMLALALITLSYRRQETLYGGPYPAVVRAAITRNLVELPFYRTDQTYTFTTIKVTGENLLVRLKLEYTVVNRTKDPQDLLVVLTPMRRSVTFLQAVIGGVAYDVNDPHYRTQSGLRIPCRVAGGSSTTVVLEDEVHYREEDSDLLASYAPATDLTLVVQNDLPEVRIVVESLFSSPVVPIVKGGERRYHAPGALLPYQGFKVDWMSTEGEQNLTGVI